VNLKGRERGKEHRLSRLEREGKRQPAPLRRPGERKKDRIGHFSGLTREGGENSFLAFGRKREGALSAPSDRRKKKGKKESEARDRGRRRVRMRKRSIR